jgi:hypothetical protein
LLDFFGLLGLDFFGNLKKRIGFLLLVLVLLGDLGAVLLVFHGDFLGFVLLVETPGLLPTQSRFPEWDTKIPFFIQKKVDNVDRVATILH